MAAASSSKASGAVCGDGSDMAGVVDHGGEQRKKPLFRRGKRACADQIAFGKSKKAQNPRDFSTGACRKACFSRVFVYCHVGPNQRSSNGHTTFQVSTG